MKTGELHIFYFGDFVLDTRKHSLKKGIQQIHLRPKAFDTLLYLVKHHGSLIKKLDMLDDLWPNVIVTENTLSHCIDEVRQALEDNAQDPIFIRTIPRLGFKFIADVKELKADENSTVNVEPEVNNKERKIDTFLTRIRQKKQTPLLNLSSKKKFTLIGVIVILLLGLSTAVVFNLINNNDNEIKSIAVLPFINLNVDTDEEYFADGMTEALISNLGKIKLLRVISRTSVMSFKNASKPLPEIAKQLNVDAIVEGSVMNANNRVRITAKLISANSDQLLWVKSYERDMQDILKLQGELAKEIASEIKINLTSKENANVAAARPVNPEAYTAYLKGRYFWNMRTSEGFNKAIEQFHKAITIDSEYAPAYTGLSDTYILQGNYGMIQSNEATAIAKKYVSKALALDDALAEAHVSLSACLTNEWDIIGAKREMERAIELNPNYATAHQWYAFSLIRSGLIEEGISEIKKAIQLSPLSLRIQVDLGRELYFARQYDNAIRQYKEMLELDQNFPPAHSLLGLVYLKKGDYENAIIELEKGMKLRKASMSRWLGYAYALTGDSIKADSFLKTLIERWKEWHDGAVDIALIYSGFGNKEKAFEWLKKAYDERDIELLYLNVNPLWDDIRTDSRFQELVNNIEIQSNKAHSNIM